VCRNDSRNTLTYPSGRTTSINYLNYFGVKRAMGSLALSIHVAQIPSVFLIHNFCHSSNKHCLMVLNFLECSKLYDSDLHMVTLKGRAILQKSAEFRFADLIMNYSL
jgi:hypothetical protein